MMKRLIALLLALTMMLSLVACGGANNDVPETTDAAVQNNDSAEGEPTAEAEPLTFNEKLAQQKAKYEGKSYTTVKATPAGDVLPDGQTVEDNLRTRFFTEVTGLTQKVEWSATSGDAFTQKANMMIATGDIPDYMEVGYDQYMELVESGLLADLTDYIDDLHPDALAAYESSDYADIDALTVNGKVYGIPKHNGLGDSAPLLWVRKDWMDKLGLEEPTCIADITTIAKAFMEGDPDGNGIDDTEGLSIRAKYTYPGSGGGVADIFANYGAIPFQWEQQEDGTMELGTLQPEALETLKLLNSWYEEGIIAEDFATVDSATYQQKVTSGKTGMFFGAWWLSWSWLTDTVMNDPECEWVAYALPKEPGQDYLSAEGDPASNGIGVISANCEDPEMIIYAINAMVQSNYNTDLAEKIQEIAVVSNLYSPIMITFLPADAIINTGVVSVKYANGEIDLDGVRELSVPSDAEYNVSIAQNAKVVADAENPYDHMTDWSNAMGYTIGMMALHNSNVQFVRSDFAGKTEAMEKNNTFLEKLVNDAYTKMIMGDTDGLTLDKYFENFVQQYMDQGGAEVYAEVQAAADAMK